MAINLETALKRGLDRTLARNGLILAGLLFVVSTVNELVGLGVARWVAARSTYPVDSPFLPQMEGALFAVPPEVGGLVSLLTTLAMVVLVIGALRLFVSEETDELPVEHFTENLVWPGLNFIVGGIVFGIIVAVGFVLLVIPGVFLLVTLVFWTVYVAVEDRNFIDGLRASWGVTRGHRFRLFFLGLAVLVVQIVVGVVFGAGGALGGTVGVVITQIGSALALVFSLATLAAAYDQVTSSEAAAASSADGGDADPAA